MKFYSKDYLLILEKYDTDCTEIAIYFDSLRYDIGNMISNYEEPFFMVVK